MSIGYHRSHRGPWGSMETLPVAGFERRDYSFTNAMHANISTLHNCMLVLRVLMYCDCKVCAIGGQAGAAGVECSVSIASTCFHKCLHSNAKPRGSEEARDPFTPNRIKNEIYSCSFYICILR